MPIPLARAQAHIAHWTPKLPSRNWWPNHLFFAAHVSAAADIIRAGQLICRRDLAGAIGHDIANQDALGTNPAAHNYVRLYFRPKTVFHMRTEGIKLRADHFRLPAHMSVPVIFVFDLTKVVTRPNVHFCGRKMAHVGIVPGNDQNYFDAIDFERVYHDSATSALERAEIHDRRMAEVLIPDALPLAEALSMIICRTNFDAETLKHLVGNLDPIWWKKLRVSTKPAEMFFCWGSYITDLQLQDNALTLKVKSARDYKPGDMFKFNLVQYRRSKPPLVWNQEKALSDRSLLLRGWDTDHNYDWLIELEVALAFRGPIPVSQTTVVGG